MVTVSPLNLAMSSFLLRATFRIYEEAVVKIWSETSAGFSRHPFGIIVSERVAGE